MNKVFFLILFTVSNVSAISNEVAVNEIKVYHINQRLSQNTPTVIFKDSKGLMWFGTFDGLNQYDGLNINVYRYFADDTASLTNSQIQDIVEDTLGRLWIATNNGISVYNSETDNFIRYYNSPDDPNSVPPNSIIDLIVDSKGDIWGVGDEVFRYNPKEDNFTRYRFGDLLTEHLTTIFNNLYEDNRGRIWCLYFKEIYYYSPEENKLILFYDGNKNPLNNKSWKFIEMIQINNEEFWITTDNAGIIIADLYKTNVLKTYNGFKNIHEGELNSVNLLKIYRDKSQKIWISAENQGLYVFNKHNELVYHFVSDPDRDFTIGFNSVWSIYEDSEGRYWLGSWDAGVDVIDLYYSKFEHYQYLKGLNSLSNNAVRDIVEDKNGNLWISTDGGGINHFNRKTGRFKVYKHDPDNLKSISSNAALPMAWDNNGNLWIGTWNGGVNIFNPQTEEFKRLNPNNSGLSSLNVFDIVFDDKSKMYFATYGGGLCIYDIESDHWHTYINDTENEKSISNDYTFSILLDSKNNIWIGCANGLNYLSLSPPGNDEFIHYFHDPDDKSTMSSNYIVAIYEDPFERIWIGTQGGLNLFNPEDSSFISYLKADGLSNDNINSIICKNKEEYWLGTNSGLVRFNPVNLTFRNYGISDGIQGYQYSRGAARKLRSDEMVFGGINGFNIFHPDSVYDNPNKPTVIFTDFKIFNRSVKIGEEGSPLKKHISETEYIRLTYKQNVFTFNFVALNYTHPEQNQYAYMMEGFENEWNYVENQTNATYTNLSAGEYVFRVKASNNDGIWNNEGASVTLRITPPFWKTWFFRISAVVLIAFIVFSYFAIRMQTIKRNNIILERTVTERTQELSKKNKLLLQQTDELNEVNTILEERQQQIEEQAQELFTQKEKLEEINVELNEVNATKDKFFSIIAHDIKNPFGTVMGFVELMQRNFGKWTDEKKVQIIDVLYDSTQNVYNLLENLLQWSRSQRNVIEFKPKKVSLKDMTFTVFSIFKHAADDKKIKLNLDIEEDISIYADESMLNTILRNLVSNAIKFTPKGGSVTISAVREKNNVLFKIKDSGVGMDEVRLKKLFRIDSHQSTEGTNKEKGTGLGLILTKEFVLKHRGEIWVESEVGKGSVFNFRLPEQEKTEG
ncbi:MAG: hypothetical protein JW894_15175 [Bacteroidales bacterium]|nr:hypothetical protein [Bacteroidales bacterium]